MFTIDPEKLEKAKEAGKRAANMPSLEEMEKTPFGEYSADQFALQEVREYVDEMLTAEEEYGTDCTAHDILLAVSRIVES